MNKNFTNNGATNNNSNNGGRFIMVNNTINSMEVFADLVKVAVKEQYGGACEVSINEEIKNNDTKLTGLVIRGTESNLAPTIYLEGLFAKYKSGVAMTDIIDEIINIYESKKVTTNFDVSMVTELARVKDSISMKLVNAERNKELLSDAPHMMFNDLAIIFYIVLSKEKDGNATITIRNNLANLWDVPAELLYRLALNNTQRMFRGTVNSMSSVLTEMFANELDDNNAMAFFDMVVNADDIPMYVITNKSKIRGMSFF